MIIKQEGGCRPPSPPLLVNGFFVTDGGNDWMGVDHMASTCPATSLIQREQAQREDRAGGGDHFQTEVSDCSLMTNLWLFGSMNSSPSRRKGSGVTVTTREKSRRRREKTRP